MDVNSIIVKRKCATRLIKGCVDNNEALNLFAILRDTIEWEDAIIFGSSIHGIAKVPYAEPRISIATFMKPINSTGHMFLML